jgi:hypothetical protein
MDQWDDNRVPAEIDPLSDLVALWTASNPEELWRALVLQSGRSTTDYWSAVGLLRRHHRDGTPGALATTLLLCTNRRWDRRTRRLIAGIVDTSILGKDDLDELATCFLWSDRYRFEYPVGWIGTRWVGIDVDGGEGAVSPQVMHLDPRTPVPVERSIAPPLRRWAAARVLRTEPGVFDAIRARAAELATRDGGAVVSGMLDAVDVLDDGVARKAIDLGLGWTRASVRLVALDLLAAIDPEAARRRAAGDSDAKVRNWSHRRARTAAAASPEDRRREREKERASRDRLDGQAELFPE